MKLRTLDGKGITGELTTEYPISPDGSPVLLVGGEPYGPEDAEFFLESATPKERKQLEMGGYDLPRWSEYEGGEEFTEEEFGDEEFLEDDWEDH